MHYIDFWAIFFLSPKIPGDNKTKYWTSPSMWMMWWTGKCNSVSLKCTGEKKIDCFKVLSTRFITEYCYAICWEKKATTKNAYLISSPLHSETIWCFFKYVKLGLDIQNRFLFGTGIIFKYIFNKYGQFWFDVFYLFVGLQVFTMLKKKMF